MPTTKKTEEEKEDTRTFAQRLCYVQKALKVPKNQYNSFGKYNYRSAEDILEAVKPLCADNDILLTISDDTAVSGEWHYIKSTVTVRDARDITASFSTTGQARESATKKGMDDSQITGTASSYARKYALNGMFLIDDTKDADTDEYKKVEEKTKQSGPTRAQKIAGIKGQLEKMGIHEAYVLKLYGHKSLEEFPDNALDNVMNNFSKIKESQDKNEIKPVG